MASVAITGNRYRAKPEQADKHGPFQYRILAEGDSWMDASAAAQGSLPEFLVREFNRRKISALIINISTSGQTLQRIHDTMRGDLVWWLRQYPYDGILFSAGGNDFIDAARDPDPGQGLLRDMAGQPLPVNGYDCVLPDAVHRLEEGYLGPNFAAIYEAIRGDALNSSTPLFLNCYDTPVARNAPAIPGVGPWLYKAYTKNQIDPSLWQDLTTGLFADIEATIEGWSAQRTGIHLIPTTGVLQAANPGSTASSGDWVNEIHPNAQGWAKLARIWADQVLQIVSVA